MEPKFGHYKSISMSIIKINDYRFLIEVDGARERGGKLMRVSRATSSVSVTKSSELFTELRRRLKTSYYYIQTEVNRFWINNKIAEGTDL